MDDTASLDRDGRFTACLERLEELKAVKARREVLEERVFLEFLRANRSRINEFPLLETEQQSLMDMLLRRAEGLHPGHARGAVHGVHRGQLRRLLQVQRGGLIAWPVIRFFSITAAAARPRTGSLASCS